jgi:hypothetical protein
MGILVVTKERKLPYPRKSEGVAFAAPKVLNLDVLRTSWQPWLDLSCADHTNLIARNAWATWTRVAPRDPDDPLARPWSAMFASGGLRSFVVAQARHTDYLAIAEGPMPPAMQDLRAAWPEWLDGDALQRLRAATLLGSLTATLPLFSTTEPDPAVPDVIHQHFCYERAKAIRARDPQHEPSARMMAELAHRAIEPAIRVLAVINLVAYSLRFEGDVERSASWVAHGVSLLPALAEHPDWLAQMLRLRFRRIEGYHYTVVRDQTEVERALDEAMRIDGELRELTAGHELLASLWQESHALLMENVVKSRIGRRLDDATASVVARLDALPTAYPELDVALGDLLLADGRPDEASVRYERAAHRGAIAGAIGAFRAHECHQRIGDADNAYRCLLLLADLDPAADVAAS